MPSHVVAEAACSFVSVAHQVVHAWQIDVRRSAGAAHRELVERLAVMDGGARYVSCGRDGTAKCGIRRPSPYTSQNDHHGTHKCTECPRNTLVASAAIVCRVRIMSPFNLTASEWHSDPTLRATAAAEADPVDVVPQAVVRPRPEPAADSARGHIVGHGCHMVAGRRQAGSSRCRRNGGSLLPPLHGVDLAACRPRARYCEFRGCGFSCADDAVCTGHSNVTSGPPKPYKRNMLTT